MLYKYGLERVEIGKERFRWAIGEGFWWPRVGERAKPWLEVR